MEALNELGREELIAIILELLEQVGQLQARVAALEQENARLRSQLEQQSNQSKPDPPSFVKPNRPEREKKPRKRRERPFFRRREEPTEVVVHAVSACPQCGRKLSGGWVHRRRQVIELPEAPVRIIEHRMLARHCGVCHKHWIAQPDLSGEVVGQHRVGIGLMSLIALLRKVGRVPIRGIQALLERVWGLHLGLGEISAILCTVAQRGRALYEQLRRQIRASPAVNADETSWREDGHNGWLWSFGTPQVRFYVQDRSRGSQVAVGVLGDPDTGPDAFGEPFRSGTPFVGRAGE